MTQYIIFIPLVIQLLGLMLVVFNDKYISKKHKKIMTGIIVLISLLILQNYTEYILTTKVSMPFIRTLVGIAGYSLRPFILVLFCKLVRPNSKHRVAWALATGNAVVYLTAVFSHITFYITADNRFSRGSLGYTAFAVSAVLLVYLANCTLYQYRSRRPWIWMTVANVIIIVISVVLDIIPAYHDYPVSYLTIAVVSCSLFYYIWLHLEFVREHEKALIAEQRIKIMMSQIQPHFLYNTLSTIQALCLINPKKAFETTEKFGTYLRNNIDSLNRPELIELNKELEHTRIYAEIEMLRFPKITVEYDIQAEDFSISALSIQPLVENAIRHGVRSREHGEVCVSTREENGFYKIIISDNGIGFDTEKMDFSEGKHIGISNVRERIEKMCGGTLKIESQADEGTVITISIPKNREDQR